MKILALAVLSILLSVTAQFTLKAGMSSSAVKASLSNSSILDKAAAVFGNSYVILGFLLYGLGAVVWLAVLEKWDVSKAYPLVGFGFAITAGVGIAMGEQVSAARVAGVVLICTGVYLVGRS